MLHYHGMQGYDRWAHPVGDLGMSNSSGKSQGDRSYTVRSKPAWIMWDCLKKTKDLKSEK